MVLLSPVLLRIFLAPYLPIVLCQQVLGLGQTLWSDDCLSDINGLLRASVLFQSLLDFTIL